MPDVTIRELERAVAQGLPGSADALRRERNRRGQGARLYVADLLEQAGLERAELSSIANGFRAVVKALGIKARVFTSGRAIEIRDLASGPDWRAWKFATEQCGCGLYADGDHVYLCQAHREALSPETLALYEDGKFTRVRVGDLESEAHAEVAIHEAFDRSLCQYFDIKSLTIYHSHREDKSRGEEDYFWPAGPKLAPEHQEIFLDAVRANENRTPPAQRAIAAGNVVRFRVGGRRRYVVAALETLGARLSLVALSGGERGSAPSGVDPEQLTLDEDQTVAFTGPNAHKLEAKLARTRELWRSL